MNLIEAIRSGRPIRRPIPKHLGSNGDGWISGDYILGLIASGQPTNCVGGRIIERQDILADDWEIQQPTLTVTYEQFCKALNGPVSPHVGEDGVAIDFKKAWKFLEDASAGKPIPGISCDDEEPSVTISRSQFWEACASTWEHPDVKQTFLAVIARKLGLEGETR